MELFKKYRPDSFDGLVGQPTAVKILKDMAKRGVPHAVLLQGPSGTGKTSAARILAKHLKSTGMDLQEMNCADVRGIDAVRDIVSEYRTLAMTPDGTRVYIIDEGHKLTNDAQNALLKPLEDPPEHVYWIICTTEPSKLLATVRRRCAKVEFKAVSSDAMIARMKEVAKAEKLTCKSDQLYNRIVETVGGNLGEALVLLENALRLDSIKEQVEYVSKQAEGDLVYKLCKELIQAEVNWAQVTGFLSAISDEPESVRRRVLAFCNACLMREPTKKVARVMHAFSEPFFDQGTAKYMLTLACFDAAFRQ